MKKTKSVTEIFLILLCLLGCPINSSKNEIFKIPLRAIVVLTVLTTALSLGIISIYIYWNDSHRRLMIFEDMIIASCGIVPALVLLYTPNNSKTLLNVMIYSTFDNDKFIDKRLIDNMTEKANKFSWNILWYMVLGVTMYWGMLCILPFITFINQIFYKDTINLINVVTPFPSFYILTIENNLTIFTINFIIQIITYALSLLLIAIWLLLQSCSLVYTAYELKLLSEIISNMDSKIYQLNLSIEYKINESTTDFELNDIKLKSFLVHIHHLHLKIKRKMININKSLKFSSFFYNQLVCLHFSLMLYCSFQNNEISGKGKYVLAYLSTLNCYGMSCIMGQFLINKSEDLWNSLISCSWVNKPLWFTKGILMLLNGTRKPLKLEPAGLYTLDLKFLLKVMQVSYSYCNFMLQFNNKKN